MSQFANVCIVTGYGLDGWGSIPGKIYPFSVASRLAQAHPASCQMGAGASFPGGKVAGMLS
jgi:hypothetical protein